MDVASNVLNNLSQHCDTHSKMNFFYNFDIGKEIPHFKRMSTDIQSRAESDVVEVIYESFVLPGDQDYFMARLLAQKGLHRGFHWAAAQATEKYLKAFLLMNGVSVLRFKFHPIKKLYDAARNVEPDFFAKLDIKPHPKIQIGADDVYLLTEFTTSGFLQELESQGSPQNRYNSSGVKYDPGHLFAMDGLSFKLRDRIGVPQIGESFKGLSPDLLTAFENCNPWFLGNSAQSLNEIPTDEFPIQFVSTVTKFETLTKYSNNPAYTDLCTK